MIYFKNLLPLGLKTVRLPRKKSTSMAILDIVDKLTLDAKDNEIVFL